MKPSLQFSIPFLNLPDNGKKPPTFEYIFFELPSAEFPFKIDKFYIANGWCSGKGRYNQVMKIVRPNGTTLVNTGGQIVELKSADEPFMILNNLQDIEFSEPGIYKIQIFLDDELVLEYPLPIRQLKK